MPAKTEESRLRSKYVFIKSILNPHDKWFADLKEHDHDVALVWARHDAHDGDDVEHFHAVIRFSGQMDWTWLRSQMMRDDPHSYSKPARSWQRCIRYLLHLDNPDKPPVPRENLGFAGGIGADEVEMLLGKPRGMLLTDIRNAGRRSTFELVDWLVNERGHGPGEVAQMLRCIVAVNQFLGPLSNADGVPAVPALSGATVDDDGLPEDLEFADGFPKMQSDVLTPPDDLVDF